MARAVGASKLSGKHVGMVVFSEYPADPRPRRAAEALLREGMTVDLICIGDPGSEKNPQQGLLLRRVPIKHRRGGALSYVYTYMSFILASGFRLTLQSLRRRYDLVYVHNMPDTLVFSALFPKLFGAKVILDLHDPMPELLTTIYGLGKDSFGVRLMKFLEKCSLAMADQVLTVNIACQKIFSARSCSAEKIGVVMNAPDEQIFPFQPVRLASSSETPVARPFVIMYHGSLVERNGLDLAIQALAEVRKNIPNAELRVYGSRTPFLDRVLQQTNAMGLADCVHYLGPRRLEQLVKDIAAADVGVIPNHKNAFTEINTPTRIMEYLSAGTPVVAPDTAGILDYFEPDSLFFFECGNWLDLASQIERVHADPERAVKITEKGQQVYLQHTWSRERSTLIDCVSRLLRKHGVAQNA